MTGKFMYIPTMPFSKIELTGKVGTIIGVIDLSRGTTSGGYYPVQFAGDEKCTQVHWSAIKPITDKCYNHIINNDKMPTIEIKCSNCKDNGKWCEARDRAKLWEVTCKEWFTAKQSCECCSYYRPQSKYNPWSTCMNDKSEWYGFRIKESHLSTCDNHKERVE